MSKLKRLFCLHKWSTHYDIGYDDKYLCTKCGKWKNGKSPELGGY
jgi:hypothetical protein